MPVDPRHQRNLPAGLLLSRLLRRVFQRQAHDATSAILSDRPVNLARWNQTLADLAKPILTHYVGDGGADCMRRLRRQLRQRPARKGIFADTPAQFGFAVGDFDLFNPRVLDAVQQAVLLFAASTNATSQLSVEEAREQTRRALREGMERGETVRQLQRRIGQIFQDGPRAGLIARTESSRAVHLGQVLAAKESGIVKGKKWLTSSEPCPLCAKLNGKVVGLDEPFWINPQGGTYAIVSYPPLHPRCVCTILEEIDWQRVRSAA